MLIFGNIVFQIYLSVAAPAQKVDSCGPLLTSVAELTGDLRVSEGRRRTAAGDARWTRLLNGIATLSEKLTPLTGQTLGRDLIESDPRAPVPAAPGPSFFADFPEADTPRARENMASLSAPTYERFGFYATEILSAALPPFGRLPADTFVNLRWWMAPPNLGNPLVLRREAFRLALIDYLERAADNPYFVELVKAGMRSLPDTNETARTFLARGIRDLRRRTISTAARYVAGRGYSFLFLEIGEAARQDGIFFETIPSPRSVYGSYAPKVMRAHGIDADVADLVYPALAVLLNYPLPLVFDEIDRAISVFARRLIQRIPVTPPPPKDSPRSDAPADLVPPPSAGLATKPQPRRPPRAASILAIEPEREVQVASGRRLRFAAEAVKWMHQHPARAHAVVEALEKTPAGELGHDLVVPRDRRVIRHWEFDERVSVLWREEGSAWRIYAITSPEFVAVKLRTLAR